MNEIIHSGGCHCRQVQFEFHAPTDIEVFDCNCSVCFMVGYEHLILPASKFQLLSPLADLMLYEFNERIAKHYFCATCGIKSFYVPRSNPDGISVNFRCVDQRQFTSIKKSAFDGANFEANASMLAHLSR